MRTRWEYRCLWGALRSSHVGWVWVLILTTAAVWAMTIPAAGAPGVAVRPEAWELRSDYTSDFGVAHPVGVAYDPALARLLVADNAGTLIQLSPTRHLVATSSLPEGSQLNLAFDPIARRLTLISGDQLLAAPGGPLGPGRATMTPAPGGLDVVRASGSTYASDTGTQYILDGARHSVAVLESGGRPRAQGMIDLRKLPSTDLKGIAFNPADGLLYVASYADARLYGIDTAGRLVADYSLAGIELADPQGMVFAPTRDNTDDPADTSLFIADAGTDTSNGSVVEVSLAPQPEAAPDLTATLVQTTNLFEHDPPSPDPAGIAYIRHKGGLLVSDSEVDEMPWLFDVNQVNLFPLSLGGSAVPLPGIPGAPYNSDPGVEKPWASQEPSGLAYDPAGHRLFVSNDDKAQIYIVQPGTDGYYGTPDDWPSTRASTGHFHLDALNADAEDVTYNPANGHLYTIDGVGAEVYEYSPGADDLFGTVDDPAVTHFDVYAYGATDPEGIVYYPAHGTLLVLEHRTKLVFEVSLDGLSLLQTIDVGAMSTSSDSWAAGLALAPASDGSAVTHVYLVDRAVDNGADPLENDGRMYEMAAGFESVTHAITPSAGPGGAVSPAGVQTVIDGADLTFTVTPDPGYYVLDVLVDGASVGALADYTFTEVTGDHTIDATFWALTVTAPNGSESWANGSVHDLSWTVSPAVSVGAFNAWLIDGVGNWVATVDTVAVVDGQADYSVPWTVSAPTRADYRLSVWYRPDASVWGGWTANDQSDAD